METPNDVINSEKPLKLNPMYSARLDINILKSKLEVNESKIFKKKQKDDNS